MRTTEFAPALDPLPVPESSPVPTKEYGPPQWAQRSFTGGFSGSAFRLQPDGSLLCPANHPLYAQERRPERDGSLRVLYAGRIGFCRLCSLRAHCQESLCTQKPRRVSAVFWPVSTVAASSPLQPVECPPSAPLLWRDWPRCLLRRQWLKLIRRESVTFSWESPPTAQLSTEIHETVLTRTQRAHYRLSWLQRLTRNARRASAPGLRVLLHGLPSTFFASLTPAQEATA